MMGAVVDVDRLAKLCGLFGSDHLGERAAAAAKAHDLVRGAGLTWPEVLAGPHASQSGTHRGDGPQRTWRRELTPAVILATYGAALTGWEKCFLAGLAKRGASMWTDRQIEVLDGIRGRFQ
jgi:hypothetical protein